MSATKQETTVCDFCNRGHIVEHTEEIAFRQRSDKGYIHCRVTVSIGVCDQCGTRTLDANADNIFDAAFQREYDRL